MHSVVNEDFKIRNIEGVITCPNPQPISADEGGAAIQADDETQVLHEVFPPGLIEAISICPRDGIPQTSPPAALFHTISAPRRAITRHRG